jgi:hypothetical protein
MSSYIYKMSMTFDLAANAFWDFTAQTVMLGDSFDDQEPGN